MYLWKQPEILVIQLKRFGMDSYGNNLANKEIVSFPIQNLDLTPYTHPSSTESRGKYDLYAVVRHFGDLNYGHYTSICWNDYERRWLSYNDDSVSDVSIKEVLEIAENSEDPYILFYRRV
jgi:ubiquitin C-terminal hydrolase